MATHPTLDNVYSFFAIRGQLRAVGITIRYDDEWGEYRINFRGGDEATAYYTDDLEDALFTGLDMADRKSN